MLQLTSKLGHLPILSLRTGGPVAYIDSIIINPHNLRVEGWYVTDRFSKEKLVLRYQDVREVIKRGIVVNDHDVLTPAAELVRLQDIMDLAFVLNDKPVYQGNRKIGKVTDYAVEVESFFIQKLYVGQNILKSLSGDTVIDRQQIVEVTPKKVVVKGTEVKSFAPLKRLKAEFMPVHTSPSPAPPNASLTRE